jgi:hypothetical protein
MDKKILIVSLLFLIFILFLKRSNKTIEKMSLVEAFDKKKYLVRDLNDKTESADLLAQLMDKLKLLIVTLKRNSDNTSDAELKRYKKFIESIYYKIDGVKVRENEGGNDLTSYSVNKGEELVFCIRSKSNNQIHDINELMYVAIHEIAHIGCPETGHTRLFAKINLFLLRQALQLKLYNYRDYSMNPVEYCGMTLTTNILG